MKWIEKKPTREEVTDLRFGTLGIVAAAEGGQEQKKRSGGGEGSDADKSDGGQKLKKKGDELKEEMDDLVSEIDDLLEENAEEFVKNYVQRGGE